MSDSWKKIFNGNLEGRNIEIEEYDGGGYKVKTTQNKNDGGSVSVDKSSTTIIPPTEAGREALNRTPKPINKKNNTLINSLNLFC